MKFKKDKYYNCLADVIDNVKNEAIFNKGKRYFCIANDILLGENYREFQFNKDRECLKELFEEDIDSNFDSLFEMVKDIQKKLDYLIKTM